MLKLALTSRLDRFVPAGARADPSSRRAARIIVVVAVGSALVDGLFAAFFLAVMDIWQPAVAMACASVATMSIPWLLRRTSTDVAGNALALVAFLAIGATSFVRGGFLFPVFVWSLAIPLGAAILDRSRTMVVWSVLVAAQGAALLTFGEVVAPTRYAMLSMLGLLGVIVAAGLFLHNRERELTNEQRTLRKELLNQQRLESVGLLSAGVAHDLNNVLSVIRMRASLGLDESEGDPRAEDFQAIVEATARGAKLTTSLLGFGRSDTNSSVAAADASETIGAMSAVFGTVLESGVEVEFQLEDGLPCVAIGSQRLEHVVVNLVVNAGDAMPDGGHIRVSTSYLIVGDDQLAGVRPGEYVVVQVNDSGFGMSPDRLDQIFEPFFTTKESGTGIGLASVRATVRSSGGSIQVSSVVGRGSEFRVFLPVKESTGVKHLSGAMKKWRTSGTRRRRPASAPPSSQVRRVG